MSVSKLFDVTGKHVIVTGGTRGIGKGIAQGFLENGCKVVLIGSNKVRLEETVHGFQEQGYDAHAVVADLAELEQMDRAFEESMEILGGVLDVLVPCAGVQHRSAPEDFPIDKFIWVQKVNVLHCYRMAQLAIQVMLKQKNRGRGKIILIGSLGSFTAGHNISAYACSKGAVAMMTKALAESVAGRGINVNMLAPGYIKTEIWLTMDEDRKAHLADRIPMGRIGDLDDMIGPALFLASKASDFVNGELLVADGGQNAIH